MWRPEEQQHRAIAGESIGRERIVVPESVGVYLSRAIGCRLHGEWEIQDRALRNSDVRAWLKLPPTPPNI